MGSETSCRISGDLFDVEIVLDGSDNRLSGPDVLDVKISFSYSKQAKSCPELVEIIRYDIGLVQVWELVTAMSVVSEIIQFTQKFMSLASGF